MPCTARLQDRGCVLAFMFKVLYIFSPLLLRVSRLLSVGNGERGAERQHSEAAVWLDKDPVGSLMGAVYQGLVITLLIVPSSPGSASPDRPTLLADNTPLAAAASL